MIENSYSLHFSRIKLSHMRIPDLVDEVPFSIESHIVSYGRTVQTSYTVLGSSTK
jgi:hypothetical protein